MSATTERARVATVVLAATAILVCVGVFSASARAEGVTYEQLQAAGWICYSPPGSIDRIVCFDPGVGRPFPGNPDPAPSYNGLLFGASSGELLLKIHFIRADLYAGQRCGNEPYVFRALIGYWECVHGVG
jgi:hypothetical protein